MSVSGSSSNAEIRTRESESDQFHDILKERKAERKRMTKEKCEAAARLIQGLKSMEGIQPVEIFPPEVWKLILEKLNPEEKWTMCELHMMFGKLMQPTIIQDILLPKLIDSEAMVFHSTQRPFDRFGLRIIMVPPTMKFATLRCLSKSVRNAVDNYQENNLLKYIRYESSPKYLPKMNIDLILGDVEERENKILKYFVDRAAAGKNGKWDLQIRSLQIKIDTGGNSKKYLADLIKIQNDVTCFLKQIGHRIWRFHLVCGDFGNLTNAPLLSKLYKTFFYWLELMPQVKMLDIKLTKTMRAPLQSIQDVVEVGPAPKLENLERFEMAMMTPRADVVEFYKEFLKINSHIRKFCYIRTVHEMDTPFGDEFLLGSGISQQLPNLDSLDLKEVVPIQMDVLRNCVNYNWPLKNLFLCLESDYNCINDIFRFLEKFPTLENVSLKLFDLIVSKPPGEEEKNHISFLRLPNLKKFHLILYHNNPDQFCSGDAIRFFFNIHFLLHCSELRSIKWETVLMHPEIKQKIDDELELTPEDGMVYFWDGRSDLTESNIWNVFPHLKDVVVEIDDGLSIRGTRRRHDRVYRNRQIVNW